VSVDIRRAHSFTERTNLSRLVSEYLDTSLGPGDPPHSLALWGLGGSGKSQLALRYLETHEDRYNPIIWVDARTPETARAAFWAVFLKLGLPWPAQEMDQLRKGTKPSAKSVNIRDDSFVKAVLDWLETWQGAQKQWLLVLDNADDLTWARNLIPRGKGGSVIVTSTDREIRSLVHQDIEVQNMSENEALELLFKSAGVTRSPLDGSVVRLQPHDKLSQDALDIVNRLGKLALAVDLAGAYIGQRAGYQEDFSLYLQDLRRSSVEILAKVPAVRQDNYSETIITVWETSFDAVKKTNPLSAQLLNLFTFFDRTHLDDRLFHAASMGSVMRKTKPAHPSTLEVIWFSVLGLLSASCLPAATLAVLTGFGKEWRFRPSHRRKVKENRVYIVIGGLTLYLILHLLFALLVGHISKRRRRINPDTLFAEPSDGEGISMLGFQGALISIVILALWPLRDNSDNPSLLDTVQNIFTSDGPHVMPDIIMDIILRCYEHLCRIDEWLPLRLGLLSLVGISLFFGLYATWVSSIMYIVLWVCDFNPITKESITNAGQLLEGLMFSEEDLSRFNNIERRLSKILLDQRISPHESILVILEVFFVIGSLILAPSVGMGSILGIYIFTNTPQTNVSLFKRSGLALLILNITAGYISYRAFSWFGHEHPEKKLQRQIQDRSEHTFVVELLTTTDDDNKWNPQLYSEAYSVLTRFNFLQRTKSIGFSMHSLVQGWARHRMDAEEIEIWIREGKKLFTAIVHDEEVWYDFVFQSQLVQHLLELLTAHVQNGHYDDDLGGDLVVLLNACLRRVELSKKG
jgi:hypothetical protein